MKNPWPRLIKLLTIFALAALPVFAQEAIISKIAPSDPKSAHADEFIRLAESWRQAYNGDDAAKLAPFYAEEAVYISSHVQGLTAQGKERVLANFQKGMSAGGHIDALEILSIHESCDLATLLCKYHANNNGQKVVGRNLLVVKRIQSRWLIVQHMTVV